MTIVAAGTIAAYGGNLANLPSNWMNCDGSSVSQATYPDLFTAIGYSWGGTSPNFCLPDLRGYFLRGVDEGVGVDPDSSTRQQSTTNQSNNGNSGDNVGSLQADQVGPHTQTVIASYSNASNNGNTFITGYNEAGPVGGYMAGYDSSNQAPTTQWNAALSTTETRAKNKYVYWIICTKNS
ncbi:MAG TPA: phage tail protein [Thermoanaerobaculia bacterium]|nr:phage tail protein [Thermoanaerobaculia bacterium]